MAQLRHDFKEFTSRHTQIVVVGPEDAAAFRDYWQQHKLPFIGLPDPTASVLKLYGQEVNLFKLGRMPAQVIIDQRWRCPLCPLWPFDVRYPGKPGTIRYSG